MERHTVQSADQSNGREDAASFVDPRESYPSLPQFAFAGIPVEAPVPLRGAFWASGIRRDAKSGARVRGVARQSDHHENRSKPGNVTPQGKCTAHSTIFARRSCILQMQVGELGSTGRRRSARVE
jgi:hypothetical protein